MINTPIISIPIHDLSRAGSGVGRLADGRIVFVPFTCPGDQVLVQIETMDKKYATAKLIKIETPSPRRAVPPCPVFGKCGGCAWQHIPYDLQWQTKSGGLAHALKRVGVTDIPLVEELPADQIWNYRNRIQLHGQSDAQGVKFGFYEPGTKNIVPIEDCKIARAELNEKIPVIRGTIQDKIRTVGANYAPRNHKVELEVFPDGKVEEYWNAKHAAGGFRQVHDAQNKKLKAWVAREVVRDATARVLYDIFGGSGNLSLELATRYEEIYCVDLGALRSPAPGTPENFHFIRADVTQWISQTKGTQSPAAAILDPPRMGLGTQFDAIEKKLREFQVNSVIAVGCDVDTWAKDVSRFLKRGWRLSSLAALDLFPQTPHLEALARLDR